MDIGTNSLYRIDADIRDQPRGLDLSYLSYSRRNYSDSKDPRRKYYRHYREREIASNIGARLPELNNEDGLSFLVFLKLDTDAAAHVLTWTIRAVNFQTSEQTEPIEGSGPSSDFKRVDEALRYFIGAQAYMSDKGKTKTLK